MTAEITLDEFIGTIYHTKTKIVVPILDTKLEKKEYFNNGKFNQIKLNKHLKLLYDEYFREE
jgi:hypothetical protein